MQGEEGQEEVSKTRRKEVEAEQLRSSGYSFRSTFIHSILKPKEKKTQLVSTKDEGRHQRKERRE